MAMRKETRNPSKESMVTHENYLSKVGDLMCGQEGPGKGNWQGMMKARAYLLGGLIEMG